MARTTRTTPETTTRAVGYIRVSTDKQADHGISLDAQRSKLEAYAALYDIELVTVIVDAGVSAKTLDSARACSKRWVCSAVVKLMPCW